MYWADYYEVVDFNKDNKRFKVTAKYSILGAEFERETFVDNASDAPAVFKEWRKEFKKSLTPVEQKAA